MPALILRDMSPTLYQLLKEDARRFKRSMNRQAVTLLEKALLPPPKLNLADFPKPVRPKRPIHDGFIKKAIARDRA